MITIKKYPNRRLYDTHRSAYVNLEELAQRIREGEELQVLDTRTGADLTHEVLTQIVLEVLRGNELLPIGMLRRIIRASGTSPAHLALRRQLVTGLQLVSAQLDSMEALASSPAPPMPPPGGPPAPPLAPDPSGEDAELIALRDQLAALEARLDRHGR